jgi:hypothetical protein
VASSEQITLFFVTENVKASFPLLVWYVRELISQKIFLHAYNLKNNLPFSQLVFYNIQAMNLRLSIMGVKISFLLIFCFSAPILSFAVLPPIGKPASLGGTTKASGRFRHRHRRQNYIQHILSKGSTHFATSLVPVTSSILSSPTSIRPLHVLAALPLTDTINAIARSYSIALNTHPLLTKALTSVVLCGAADVIAQLRSRVVMSYIRIARFASKAFVGGTLWAVWYDMANWILREENLIAGLNMLGFRTTAIDAFVCTILKTVLSLLMEQFFWCPIVFGLWEIPMATILNGASPSRVPFEIRSKLGSMLVQNAKVWTFANIIIYNSPIQYRAGLGNVVDVFWQSIVSDFAADCGSEEVRINDSSMSSAELNVPSQFIDEKVSIIMKNNMNPALDQAFGSLPTENSEIHASDELMRDATAAVA